METTHSKFDGQITFKPLELKQSYIPHLKCFCVVIMPYIRATGLMNHSIHLLALDSNTRLIHQGKAIYIRSDDSICLLVVVFLSDMMLVEVFGKM